MGKNRILLQNWIVDLGFDPRQGSLPWPDGGSDNGPSESTNPSGDPADDNTGRIRQEVEAALKQLPEEERELIERFHFMGQSYRELSERSGRAEYRLESIHRRGLRRLRRLLAPLVKELYGLSDNSSTSCPLCQSPRRAEIDRLILLKPESDTWRPTMMKLREVFGIAVRSPQMIMGHKRYH